MMEPNDRYLSWKSRRAAVDVPADLGDRVMAAVAELEKKEQRRLALGAWLASLVRSRAGRIGLCTLAGLVCVLRVLHVVAVFIP